MTAKIIISHDIDHISLYDHYFRDLVLPRFLCARILGYILHPRRKRYLLREAMSLFSPRSWSNFRKVIELDLRKRVPSTTFIAVKRGKGISYTLDEAKTIACHVLRKKLAVGLHGQSSRTYNHMKHEKELFSSITGLKIFGIRLHYLEWTPKTEKTLACLGYPFDSSRYSSNLLQPYRNGNLLEFPIHLMDSWLLGPFSPWGEKAAFHLTIRLLEEAGKRKMVLNVVTHPNLFGKYFHLYQKWYGYLIEEASQRGFEFVSYEDFY